MIYLIVIVLCYLLCEGLKHTKLPNEWLPIISGALGAIFTGLGQHFFPAYAVAPDLLQACVQGLFYGLAATGGNQVVKQMIKLLRLKHGVNVNIEDHLPNTDKDKKE